MIISKPSTPLPDPEFQSCIPTNILALQSPIVLLTKPSAGTFRHISRTLLPRPTKYDHSESRFNREKERSEETL